MNTKLHAVTDQNRRPLSFFMTAGPISDYTGVATLLDNKYWEARAMTPAGSGTPWKRKGIKPCVPGRKSRGMPIKYDKRKYKRRNRIEIMLGRHKDWRRVATR